jgi:hypothetical protein
MIEWRDIPGYVGYQASSDGQVRSVDRMVACASSWKMPNGYTRLARGKVLRPAAHHSPGNSSGHLMVMAGRGKHLSVHVAVALAFHGLPPTPKHEVLHKDGDPANNKEQNLHWGTRSENNKDVTRQGRRKITLDEADQVRQLRTDGWPLTALSRRFDMNTGQLWHIIKGHQYVR